MRNPKRIPNILKEIEKHWQKYPDLRLGQLLINVAGHILFYIEDEDLVKKLEEFETLYIKK